MYLWGQSLCGHTSESSKDRAVSYALVVTAELILLEPRERDLDPFSDMTEVLVLLRPEKKP